MLKLLIILSFSLSSLSAVAYDAGPRLAKLPKWFKNRAPEQELEIDLCLEDSWSEQVPDASKLGPYEVETKFLSLDSKLTGRSITAKLFEAKKSGCQDSSVEDAPLVVFLAPGFIGSIPWPLDLGKSKLYDMQVYEGYMHHLASYGIKTLGLYEARGSIFSKLEDVDHKRDAMEISSFITDLIERKSELSISFDEEKLAIMGHSKGAKLAFYSATMDERIKVILAVDPVNSGGPPCFISKSCTKFPVAPNPKNGDEGILDQVVAKTLIFNAPIDKLWNPDPQFHARHFYNGLESDTFLAEVNAGHASWMFNEKVKSLTRALFVSYLFKNLKDDSGFDSYLDGDGLEHHKASGLLGRLGDKSEIGDLEK